VQSATASLLALPCHFLYERQKLQNKAVAYREAVKDKVFMDVTIGEKYAGRLLIGLYSEQCPLTCENFIQLCKGYRIHDKVIGFKNTHFFRISPGQAILGGDVITGTGQAHGMTIYGPTMPDENFDMEFIQDGDLACVNWGRNTNSSQFMITLSPQLGLYGHHVVFGTVIKGMKTVREMGELGMKTGRPALPIRVVNCGVVDDEDQIPLPPEEFMPKVGPTMTEDEFAELVSKKRESKEAAAKTPPRPRICA